MDKIWAAWKLSGLDWLCFSICKFRVVKKIDKILKKCKNNIGFSKCRCCLAFTISIFRKTDVVHHKTTLVFMKNQCCWEENSIGFSKNQSCEFTRRRAFTTSILQKSNVVSEAWHRFSLKLMFDFTYYTFFLFISNDMKLVFLQHRFYKTSMLSMKNNIGFY